MNPSNEEDMSNEGLLAQVKELRTEVRRMRDLCSDTGLSFARARIGDLAEVMASRLGTLHQFMEDPCADIRHSALAIVQDNPAYIANYIDVAKQLALRDTDAHVRLAAFHVLGKHFDESKDRLIGRFFAEIVLNSAQASESRLEAYKSLIYLEDLAFDWNPPVYKIRFPDDINWTFVERFLDVDRPE